MSNKIKFICVSILVVAMVAVTVSAQQITSITEMLSLMDQRYKDVIDYKANFTFTKKKSSYADPDIETGLIRFKYPNKLFVEFISPTKKDIVCNGKFIYVYLHGAGYYGKQEFNDNLKLYDNSKKTVAYLKNNYSLSFIGSKSLQDFEGQQVYKLKGYPRRIDAGFYKIEVYVRSDGFIVYQKGHTRDGKIFEYALKNVEINTDISDLLFDQYEDTLPNGAQVVEKIFE